jgi:hypothetical protein
MFRPRRGHETKARQPKRFSPPGENQAKLGPLKGDVVELPRTHGEAAKRRTSPMIAISRPLIGVSALIAIGIVAVDMAQSRTQETAASIVSARFPQAHERMVGAIPLPAGIEKAVLGKSDRAPSPSSRCVHEHWPYMADECLVTNGVAPTPKPARTITLERRVADNASQLFRLEG